jgi:uncharacterized Zn-finger protein
MSYHDGVRSHHCKYDGCGQSFMTKAHLNRHIKYHDGVRSHHCKYDGCGQSFVEKTDLNRHIKYHDGVRSHHCTYDGCGQSFVTKTDLIRHIKRHDGVKSHHCTYDGCGQSFVTKAELIRHIKRHEGVRSHHCKYDGCGKSFVTKGDLNEHIKYHDGVRSHHCKYDGCGKSFVTKGNLNLHIKFHECVKNHHCTYDGCGKSFVTKGNLNLHIKFHEGVKNHHCEYDGCGQSFVTKAEMNSHIKRHEGVKSHHCTYDGCGQSFVTKAEMNSHSNVHTESYHQKQKKEEEKIAKLLTSNNIDFKREHQISFSCMGSTSKFARIDFLIIKDGAAILLEVDENQHKFGEYSIACDMKRMASIHESLTYEDNTLPLYFIRYNPHSYRIGGELQKTKTVDRQQELLDVIDSISTKTVKRLSILYMYYDCDTLADGSIRLCVHGDPEYNIWMRECCLDPIMDHGSSAADSSPHTTSKSHGYTYSGTRPKELGRCTTEVHSVSLRIKRMTIR